MPARIRVLQVIKTLNLNGAERFAVELALSLDQNQFDVQMCSFYRDGGAIEAHWQQELERRGISTWFATGWRGENHYASYWQGVRRMERHLRDTPVDLINAHFQLGTLAAIYCRGRGLAHAIVRTAQNHRRKEWSPGPAGWLKYKLISDWVYPLVCDCEVGVSGAILAELRCSPGGRIARRAPRLITNAIPDDLVARAQAYPRPPREGDRYVVGSIGRLTPQKGFRYLIEAMPRVRESFPGVEFWLIGDGELKEALVEQARQCGVADCVRFWGRQADVLAWLRKMDLFVLPSLWEGFALVIMESMAAGVPVVASDIQGNQEFLRSGQNGWLAPPADPPALAATIISALSDPQARERVAANAMAALDAVTYARVARQYAQLYKDLYGAGRQTHPRKDEIRIS